MTETSVTGSFATGGPVGSTDAAALQHEIDRLLEARGRRAAAYGDHFASLSQIAAECVRGGKLLRPKLLLGTYDALRAARSTDRDSVGDPVGDVASRDGAVRIAAGIELLHYSFLLHDDVIDGDLLRRGRPNLIGTVLMERDPSALEYGSRDALRPAPGSKDLHWATSSGLLMGDMLLSDAHQVFARAPLPEALRLRLLDLLDHAITESVVGEHLDVGLSDGVVAADLNAVLEMSRLKTATYTFELPLKAGAILAAAPARTEHAMGEIGRHLGVAFQLQDDLLSTFGQAAEHGKDAFSDLREGKETAIIAYARMTSDWPSIEPAFGDPGFSDVDGEHIRRLLVRCGAERFIRSLIDDQLRACADLLSSAEAGVPESLSQCIAQLMNALEERRS